MYDDPVFRIVTTPYVNLRVVRVYGCFAIMFESDSNTICVNPSSNTLGYNYLKGFAIMLKRNHTNTNPHLVLYTHTNPLVVLNIHIFPYVYVHMYKYVVSIHEADILKRYQMCVQLPVEYRLMRKKFTVICPHCVLTSNLKNCCKTLFSFKIFNGRFGLQFIVRRKIIGE